MREKRKPTKPQVQLQLIHELSKQEKTIAHLRNLLQERDDQIVLLQGLVSNSRSSNWDSASSEKRSGVIEGLTGEIKGLKAQLSASESRHLLKLTPRLRIQINCDFEAILPNQSNQLPSAKRKHSVVLPPINLRRDLWVSDSLSLGSSNGGIEGDELPVSNVSALREDFQEEDIRQDLASRQGPIEVVCDHLSVIDSSTTENHSSFDETETIGDGQSVSLAKAQAMLKDKEQHQAKCQVLEAKLEWWRKEVCSSLNQIAKLKMAVFLKKENEFKSKDIDDPGFQELQSSDNDDCTSHQTYQPESSPTSTHEPEVVAPHSPDGKNKNPDLSIVLRDTRKECQFWENEFLHIMMENAEIRACFSGPHMSDRAPTFYEELHGRIEGLDHAITFLQEKNENLVLQINEKDRKLVAALEENTLLQSQLKWTDQCLKDTILRASAVKKSLAERLRVSVYSPSLPNNHLCGQMIRPVRKSLYRGFAAATPPLTPSGSCTILYQNISEDVPTLCRKRSDYLLSYTEESVRRKSQNMRNNARHRLRERHFNTDSSCGGSPKKKRHQILGSERDSGLGSWENPTALYSAFATTGKPTMETLL